MTEVDLKGLLVQPVDNTKLACDMVAVRNACVGSFAHDNEAVSIQRQMHWWSNWKPHIKAWLFYRVARVMPVGFGLLRRNERREWVATVAVRPGEQGKGYGSAILAYIIREVDEPVYAETRADNPAGLAVHKAEDWERVDERDGLVYWRSRLRLEDPALNEWAKEGWAVT